MARKHDVDDKHYFQMDRFYQANGEWYFTTREGMEKGPFDTRDEAEAELLLFIRDISRTDKIGD